MDSANATYASATEATAHFHGEANLAELAVKINKTISLTAL